VSPCNPEGILFSPVSNIKLSSWKLFIHWDYPVILLEGTSCTMLGREVQYFRSGFDLNNHSDLNTIYMKQHNLSLVNTSCQPISMIGQICIPRHWYGIIQNLFLSTKVSMNPNLINLGKFSETRFMRVYTIMILTSTRIIILTGAIHTVAICTFQSPLSSNEKQVCKSPVHYPSVVHQNDFNS